VRSSLTLCFVLSAVTLLFAGAQTGCGTPATPAGAADPTAPPHAPQTAVAVDAAAPTADVTATGDRQEPSHSAPPTDPVVVVPDADPPSEPRAKCKPLPSDKALASWKIRSICQPGGGPRPPPREKVHSLGDGTHIFQGPRSCYRARYRKCRTKCLPPDTLIDTPAGGVAILELEVGSVIWTQDREGKRVAAPVANVVSPQVRGAHTVAEIQLADGRSVTASLQHPMLGDRLARELQVGELYDGSEIRRIRILDYAEPHTYDLLPAGDTGIYWANEVRVLSTLREQD
jgi:hypothetical protein